MAFMAAFKRAMAGTPHLDSSSDAPSGLSKSSSAVRLMMAWIRALSASVTVWLRKKSVERLGVVRVAGRLDRLQVGLLLVERLVLLLLRLVARP